MITHQILAQSRVHFVGIGGIGMCGLAELLHHMGAVVSGSDQSENANTQRLLDLGMNVQIGHSGHLVENADVVVYSSAVKPNNPEIVEARKLKIPVIKRAEALAEIMRLKKAIAIGGSHGKTTTTGLVGSVFLAAKRDPTIVVGGRLDLIKSTAILGTGEWFIAEADESDGSFLKLSPEIVVITNIDNDHLDHFETMESLEQAFLSFGSLVPFYGAAVVCGDDPRIKRVFHGFSKRLITYGFNDDNDFILKKFDKGFSIRTPEGNALNFNPRVPGRHNALNATAAAICGLQAGVSPEDCIKGIENFTGVGRRFERKGEHKGALIYDDYGHHPTEIRATLKAFKENFPGKKIIALFQPHRVSRTMLCWNDFLECFGDADEILIADIYLAGEQAVTGVNSEKLVHEMSHSAKRYVGAIQGLSRQIASTLNSNVVFVTLGAGDVWKVGQEIVSKKD